MRVFTVLQTWSYFYSYKNITLPKVDEKKGTRPNYSALPCEERLHFRGMSSRGKSSLSRQPNKLKFGFLPVLDRFRTMRESCVSE